MPDLKLFLLGPPRIERSGVNLKLDTRKAVAMLAYLAITGEYLSRESLATLLWPNYDESRGKAALRRTLSALKSAIGEECLFITRDTIGIKENQIWYDVAQFQQNLIAKEWAKAAVFYRDDFMAGFSLRDSFAFDDWQRIQAETLRREMVELLEKLSQVQKEKGDLQEAIHTSHKWIQMDPLREEAHRQLMMLYSLSGQRNKALEQYRSCLRILDQELGVSPLPETISLYEAIRDNQIAPATVAHTNIPAIDTTSLAIKPSPQKTDQFPLVGRQKELLEMQQLYKQIEKDGRLLIVEGEAGIGKTRLGEDFVASLESQSAGVLTVRCYEGEQDLAYSAFVQILRAGIKFEQAESKLKQLPPQVLAEAGRLQPELLDGKIMPVGNLDAPGAQNRFYEGLIRVIAALLDGQPPGVLWIDDAHWLDKASLELLLFQLRRWQGRPYLIFLCWRSESLPAIHPLYRVSADLRRAGAAVHISLARLTEYEVQELMTAVLPTYHSDLLKKLYRETEGLPYFVAEYLIALPPENLQGELQDRWDLPRTVRDLLLIRLAQVNETERQLLQTAATIGHAFSYNLILLTSGRSDDETVNSIDSLVARGLFAEQGNLYDFTHAKLRQLAYEQLSLARRRLLHRRVADSLLRSAGQHLQTMALTAEVANHYRLAGQDILAAKYFIQAGDQARDLFAHRDGIHYYQSALALGYAQGESHTDGWRLHEASGDMYVRLGEYEEALISYETAAATVNGSDLGRLEYRLGQVYMRQGEWLQAEAQFALAKEKIVYSDDLARLYNDWSYVAYNLRQMAQAQGLAQQGRTLAHTPAIQAQSENISGLLTHREGDFDAALTYFRRSLSLAQQHHLPDVEIAALNNLALTEAANGNTGAAKVNFLSALDLCQTYGDRHREAALHNNLADLFHQIGDETSAMAELKSAVAIYADIGGKPGDWQPEIWKLTQW